MTSELVTNAYRHAESDARVSVVVGVDVIRVEVVDLGAGGVEILTTSADATYGRGLHIVDALADGWGHDTDEDGTRVWFELTRDAMTRRGNLFPWLTTATAATERLPASPSPKQPMPWW